MPIRRRWWWLWPPPRQKERIGMPEAQIILSQAVTYIASAPKSNAACEAIGAAMTAVQECRTSVPPHLQDAHYKDASSLGRGTGYQYAHNFSQSLRKATVSA